MEFITRNYYEIIAFILSITITKSLLIVRQIVIADKKNKRRISGTVKNK